MTGSRRDDGEQSTLLESALQSGLDLGVLLSLSQDSLNVVGLLLLAFSDGGVTLGGLGTLEDGGSVLEGIDDEHSRRQSNSASPTHVSLVPLPERSGIDFDNGTLDQGLGSEQLVVGGVVDLSPRIKPP